MKRICIRGSAALLGAVGFLAGFPATSLLWAQTVNYSGGFATSTGLAANGNAAFAPAAAPTAAQLTTAAGNEAGSFWYTTPVDIRMFNNTFTFQFTDPSSPRADGMTFTIQNQGTTALGATGGALGYAGITPSVAITLKTYDGTAAPNGYSNIVTAGAQPPVSNSIAPVNFGSGNVFTATMTYDGTNLTVVLADTTAGTTYTATYPIDIPTTIGGNTAYIGFTGGTGGDYENQYILTWLWNSLPAPTNLTATPSYGSIVLNWTAVPGATSYNILRGSTTGGPYTQIGTVTAPTTTYTDTTAQYPNTYYYVVQAVNASVTSADSNEASAEPLQPNIIVAPTSLEVVENGGMATFTVNLGSVPAANVAIVITSAAPGSLMLSSGGAPAGSVTLTFTPTGALTQQVTVTAVQQYLEGAPVVVDVNFTSVTSTDPNYPATDVPSPIPVTIIEDVPGFVINPPSGLSTVNGGPAITFTVALTTIPQGNVTLNLSVSDPTLATVAPLQITTAAYNNPVTVTVTPLSVNTQTTYIAPYEILIDSSTSTDPAYAALGVTPVPIFTPTSLPPLSKTWGSCGLLGPEGLLWAGLAALLRRRRRAGAR